MSTKRCPITYEKIDNGSYSSRGLRILSKNLTDLDAFPYSAEEQQREAVQRAAKMSVQGVQPKLSAILNIKKKTFEIVDQKGRFILKPQNNLFAELPENEDVSMKMAKVAGIEVPMHGMVYSQDGSLTYFIKRFDRVSRDKRVPVEDFAQLMGHSRDTKYNSSMEKVIQVIEKYCTFPALEKIKLFRLTLFNFLVGNEDMHLKNFSLIFRDKKVELSPAYDLLNTSIAIQSPVEEIALPLRGKKKNLTRRMLVDYFGMERLGLNEKVIAKVITDIRDAQPTWESLIDNCFLSEPMQLKYKEFLSHRRNVLKIQSPKVAKE